MNLQVFCPVCSRNIEYEFLVKAVNSSSDLYKCPVCSIRHCIPKERIFDEEFMYGDHKFSSKKEIMANHSVKKYLHDVQKNSSKNQLKTVLDLGGGLGYYSRAFAKFGLDVTQVEFDSYSLEFSKLNKSRVKGNIDIIESKIENFLTDCKNKFDIIFIRHVIEHTEDPLKLCSLIKGVMHEDSILILETDNNKSKELILHPEPSNYWKKLYREEFNLRNEKEIFEIMPFPCGLRETHWWGFNIDNIEGMLSNLGFSVTYKKWYPLGDSYLWPNISSAGKLFYRCLGHIDFIYRYLKLLKYVKYRYFNHDYQGAGLLVYAKI